MGRRDWGYVNLPKLLLKRMDKFVESSQARKIGVFNKSQLVRKLVDEFLVEQEKHYDNMESIDEFINEVEYGDHFLITYDDEKQLEDVVYAYAKRGIVMSAINVIVVMKKDELRILRALKNIKNLDSLFNSEKIILIYADDTIQDGHILIESILKKLDDLYELAKRKSMKGLYIHGFYSQAMLDKRVSPDEVYRLENKLHEHARKNAFSISIMCLYRSLSKSIEAKLGRDHHVILKRVVTKTGIR